MEEDLGSGKKRKQGSANSRFYRPLLYKCCVNLMYCEGIKNGERKMNKQAPKSTFNSPKISRFSEHMSSYANICSW